MSDVELVKDYDVYKAAPYSISKAALNLAVAKFHAEYRKQGLLFFGISPGVVDTGNSEREC
jgi:NAD(P)-dependent dehydrogenase (short-subunit alcohol dehydrogenase family)